MNFNEEVREIVSLHFLETRETRRGGIQGRGRVYWDQKTDVIETKPIWRSSKVLILWWRDDLHCFGEEMMILLWVCLVLCQVGCVWLPRQSENRWNSDVCHTSDESRVYGVHEDQLPGHSIVGIQNSWWVCSHSWRIRDSWRWGWWVGLWND